MDRLGISPDPRATHVSMIGYSSSASVVFNFKAPQNVAYVRGRLNGVTRQAGYRRPDKALELARSNLFTASGGARQGAKRVNILPLFWLKPEYTLVIATKLNKGFLLQ